MPGRQAHGRPLGVAPSAGGKRKPASKSKSNKKALDAFAIASKEYGNSRKRTSRNRGLDDEPDRRRLGSDEDGEEEDSEGGEDGAPRKRVRRSEADGAASDVEYGSDSEGREWRIGVDEGDDSEIESDDAFGESDEERFQGYSFRGSKQHDADKVS